MKKILPVFLFLFVFQFIAVSQNFDRITQIISTDEITNAQAAYIAAIYAGDVTDRSTELDAFNSLKEKGFFKTSDSPDAKIKLSSLCSLFSKVTNVKGGFMFALTKKSARYSYREFIAKGYISRNADPMMTVSGTQAIGLFNSVTEGTK